ncbi:MAG: TIR domain-containing protein, partial [Pseudomonadota bacterium]
MTDATAPPKLNVFISYSRRNSDIANLLLEDLEARGFNAYFDKEDIVVGEDWRARLRELIAGSEVIVFLVSEASTQSEICQWEIDEAQRLGKRIFPAIIENDILDRVPGSLTHINYSFLNEADKWTEELDKLDAAIKLDATWLRAHRRLAELADRWEGAGHDPGLLLRSEAIVEAEQMLARRPQNGPASSNTILAFLQVSLEKERADRDSRRRLVQRSFVQPARTALEEDDPTRALRFLAAGALLSDDPTLSLDAQSPEPAKHALWRAAAKATCDPRLPLNVLHGHGRGLWGVTLDAAGEHILSYAMDATARLWRAADGELLQTFHHPEDWVKTAQFVPRSTHIVTGGDDGIVRLWDTETGRLVSELLGHKQRIGDVCVARDGRHALSICSAPYNHEIDNHAYEALLWDLETHSLKRRIDNIPSSVDLIDFSADGNRFLIAGAGVAVYQIDAPDDVTALEMTFGKIVTYAKFSQDGKRIFTAFRENEFGEPVEPRPPGINIFDAETGALIDSLDAYVDDPIVVAISPDETLVAIDGSEETTLWDLTTRQVRLRFPKGEHGKLLLKFSPDSQKLFIADTFYADLYDVETGQSLASLSSHKGAFGDVAFSPDGTWFVTIARDVVYFGEHQEDQTVRKWRADPYHVRTFNTFAKHHIPPIATGAPDQFGIASRYGVELFITDFVAEARSFTFSPPEGIGCDKTAIAADGRWILYGDGRALAAAVRMEEDAQISPIRLNDNVSASNFSRQADTIAVGTKSGEIEIRCYPDWKPGDKREIHKTLITAIAFDPAGAFVLSAAEDGKIAVTEIRSGDTQACFTSELPRIDLIETNANRDLV